MRTPAPWGRTSAYLLVLTARAQTRTVRHGAGYQALLPVHRHSASFITRRLCSCNLALFNSPFFPAILRQLTFKTYQCQPFTNGAPNRYKETSTRAQGVARRLSQQQRSPRVTLCAPSGLVPGVLGHMKRCRTLLFSHDPSVYLARPIRKLGTTMGHSPGTIWEDG